jgi:hypothetical protein
MKLFQIIRTQSDETNRIQDNIKSALDPVLRLPISDGVFIQDVSLISGQDNPVAHKLGRRVVLWFLGGQDTNANVWQVSTDQPEIYLNLRASSNCTVSLWVA